MIFRDGLDRASRGCAARASRVAAAAVAAAVTAAKQPRLGIESVAESVRMTNVVRRFPQRIDQRRRRSQP